MNNDRLSRPRMTENVALYAEMLFARSGKTMSRSSGREKLAVPPVAKFGWLITPPPLVRMVSSEPTFDVR